MKFALYSSKKRHKYQFLKGVSKGLKKKKHKVLWNAPFKKLTPKCIVIFYFAVKNTLIEYCKLNGIRYLYIDNAYYTHLKKEYHSLSLNSPQTLLNIDNLINTDYNIPYKPYDMTGTYVLFIPLVDDDYLKWLKLHLIERTENAINNIRKYTDLPIKVRFRPNMIDKVQLEYFQRFPNIIISTDSLQTDLENCVCVYSAYSRIALEAISVGKPFICEPECFAYELSQPYSILRDGVTYDEEKIKHFLIKVKNSQFTFQDLQNGKFYEKIARYIS